MSKAWIRCVDGLTAEILTGRVVQLTRTDCSSAAQLALLAEIRSTEGADARFTKVIVAVEGRGKLAWRHELVDTLIDLILEHEDDHAWWLGNRDLEHRHFCPAFRRAATPAIRQAAISEAKLCAAGAERRVTVAANRRRDRLMSS